MAVTTHAHPGNWTLRWRTINAIRQREQFSMLYGLGIYLTVSIALTGSSLALYNNLEFVQENTVLVMIRPLYLPFFISTVLVSLYLALGAAISMTRERDQGTLEVLFYGPVDEVSYLGGKLLAQLGIYAIVTAIASVWAFAYARITNLAFTMDLLAVALFSLFTTTAVVSFGLLLASWGQRTRTALIAFVIVALVVLGIQLGDQVLAQLAQRLAPNRSDPIFFLRQAMEGLSGLFQWVSPYAQLDRAMNAVIVRDPGRYVLHLLVTLVQAGVMLAGAAYFLRRNGVRG